MPCFTKKKKKKEKKKQAKLFNKNILCAYSLLFFCICYEMWAAIRNMANQQAQAVHEWNFSRHMKTKELIQSLHYSAKSMTQVRFHQTFPNQYL